MGQIKGVHHIAIKVSNEQYKEVVSFYTEVLGMTMRLEWGSNESPCCMIAMNEMSCIEVLGGNESHKGIEGAFAHLAFATDAVDELVEKVRSAGYIITTEPKDVELGETPCRIAFCDGPVGEIIEFFHEG